MKQLNIGIIGAGRIGQVHAKSITYHIPQAEIIAISDIYVEGAKKLAEDAKGNDNLKSILVKKMNLIKKYAGNAAGNVLEDKKV